MVGYCAQVDEVSYIVQTVVAVDDSWGADKCREFFVQIDPDKYKGIWIKTAEGDHVRFAIVGGIYNIELGAFLPPKPWDSWVLDKATANWVAPVPYPGDGKIYNWDEQTTNWKLVE